MVGRENQKNQPLFVHEKKYWRRLAFGYFDNCFADEDTLVRAFNDRGSLNKNGNGYSEFASRQELQTALDQIDNPPASAAITYTVHDRTRLGGELVAIGFTPQEISLMKLSDVLKCEAAIFYATQKLYGDSEKQLLGPIALAYSPLLEKGEPDDRERVQADRDEFIAALKRDLQPKIRYVIAKIAFEKVLKNEAKSHPSLERYGEEILSEVECLTDSLPLDELSKTLTIAKEVMLDPFKDVGACIQQGKDLIVKRSAGKMLGGLLLVLAGMAIMLTNTIIAVISCGTLSPVCLVGMAVGASVGGVGLTAAGGFLFFKGYDKQPLKKPMENLANEVQCSRPVVV